jgi:hypothetical protein
MIIFAPILAYLDALWKPLFAAKPLTNLEKLVHCAHSARIEQNLSPSTMLAQPVPLVITNEGAAFTQSMQLRVQSSALTGVTEFYRNLRCPF